MLEAAIMASKSKEDKGARMVLPEQDRVGAFHVLVHMILETLRGGDRSILAALESQATLVVRYPLRAHGFLNFYFKICNIQEIQPLLLDDGWSREMASRVLGRIVAIKALVAEQIAILEDLKDIFRRVVPDLKQRDFYSNKYTKNMVRVPVLSGPDERTSGHMSYVTATLETAIEERRQFSLKGAGIFDTLQKTQATVSPSSV